MKKFTTLEEDLIKESASAQKSFDKNFIEAHSKLDIIKSKLDEFKEQYQGDLRNWGYSGSLGHVNELLDQILEFLGENEETENTYSDPNYAMSEYDKKTYNK